MHKNDENEKLKREDEKLTREYRPEYDKQREEYLRKQAEKKSVAEKAANVSRIRDLFESGDCEGAVREAKSLYARLPDDAFCQNYYAALLHAWATLLYEKGE